MNKSAALIIPLIILICLILSSLALAPASLNSLGSGESFCRSNPQLRMCQKTITLLCNVNSDCPNNGRMFCDAQGRPSRYDCLLNSGQLQCIKSTIHSACALWMPWYDRILFSCNAANQLAWSVNYGFCHPGQFCAIKHSNNFQQAVCYDFGGS
ncbi:hypothetical protein J4479_02190 [Candidatus Woesearchaeota archaeon]|nr:hypothetical protein [Candidatus Woesearchaeota archaeon]